MSDPRLFVALELDADYVTGTVSGHFPVEQDDPRLQDDALLALLATAIGGVLLDTAGSGDDDLAEAMDEDLKPILLAHGFSADELEF